MRRIFKLQMNDNAGTNYVEEVIADHRITAHPDFGKEKFESLRPGELVLVHRSSTPLYLVEINRRITNNDEINGQSFGVDFKVNVLGRFSDVPRDHAAYNLMDKVGFNGTFQELSAHTPTYQGILIWYNLIQSEMIINQSIELLKYKKQIVLQGPPGTGKTRLAKMMAAELAKKQVTKSFEEMVDSFFEHPENYQKGISEEEANEKLAAFQELFPVDGLKDLTLEQYSIGNGLNNSFCWWLERGLKPLGYYFPGNASAYLIYYSSSKGVYSVHGQLLKGLEGEEAMDKLAKTLHTIISTKKYNRSEHLISESFILKILHSYYPNEYFPINSDSCMDNVLKLMKEDSRNKSRIEKNQIINEYFKRKKKEKSSLVSSYDFMAFLFQNFDLKNQVKIEADQVIAQGETKIVQFHPSYTYEDFVRGIAVKGGEQGLEYISENRILGEFATKALDNPKANYVLIVDEINRANLSSVLGELIYALEYRGEEVESMYETDNILSEKLNSGRSLILPNNLFIIGTMNTADRSVGQIDYAIRRRFAFVDVLPMSLDEGELNSNRGENDPALFFAKELFDAVEKLFVEDNGSINRSTHLMDEFEPKDVQIGHSYFIHTTDNLPMRLNYEIKPILREYVKDGILKASASEIIEKLTV